MTENRRWIDQDFRDMEEGNAVPTGWEEVSIGSPAHVHYSIVREKGFGFLRMEGIGPGKVQVQFALDRGLQRQTAFRYTLLARSGSGAGVLLGVRSATGMDDSNAVDAAALISVGTQWTEYALPARGGPAMNDRAVFILNFAGPGQVDIAYLRVEEVPESEYAPIPALARGRPEDWDGSWLEWHWGMCVAARQTQPEIVWWGDSITAGWVSPVCDAWEREFASRQVLNLGIGGDRVEHVLWRLRDAKFGAAFSPRLTIVMIGANNLFQVHSPVDVATGMERLLTELRTRNPRGKVLLLGVLPINHDPKAGIRTRVADLNRRYRQLADGKTVVFADVGESILEADGSMSRSTSEDGTHLLSPGYDRLANAIVPVLRDMLP